MVAPKKRTPAARQRSGAQENLLERQDSTALLVTLDQGEVWTTSLLVADKFGKRHADVLRAVEKLECSPEFSGRNFALTSAEVAQPNGGFRAVPMYRITRDGFGFLAMGFTGRAAAAWKEQFIGAFNRLEHELRRLAVQTSLPDWQEARQLGKADRRDLTDAVQALCLRAHERGDSTTPLGLWETAATRVVTGALFEIGGERVAAIRARLTARQLRRLAMAEETYANALYSLIDTDAHHKAINEQAKHAVQAFAAVTGGREVPGVDCVSRRLGRQSGFIRPQLIRLLSVSVPAIVGALATIFGGVL